MGLHSNVAFGSENEIKKIFLLGQPMKIKRYLPEQDKVSVITSEKGHNDA